MDSVWHKCEIDGDLIKSLNNITSTANASCVPEEEIIEAMERAIKAVRKRLRRTAAENARRFGISEVEHFRISCELADEKRRTSALLDKVLSLDQGAAAFFNQRREEKRRAQVRQCLILAKNYLLSFNLLQCSSQPAARVATAAAAALSRTSLSGTCV
jgi:hypothetical protein